MKTLEKKMTFPEVQAYLLNHKKYRLPTIEEAIKENIKHPIFHSKTKISTNDIKLVNIYTPVLEMESHSALLVKYKIVLVHSEEFLKFKNECKDYLDKADPMLKCNILLKEMVENYF